jgi:hypothetical protein
LPPVAVDATIADRHHHPSNRGDAMNTATDRATFLRRSLQLDGIASAVCGVLLLAGARPLSDVIGLSAPGPARVVGAGLLVYAALLLWNAARPVVSRGETLAAVVLNVAWVLGSAVLIVDAPLTAVGTVAVAAVAAAVLGFTVLEVVGLRRLRAAAG